MRLNLSVEKITKEIFNEIFTQEQIKEMIEIDLSDNMLINSEIPSEDYVSLPSIVDKIQISEDDCSNDNTANGDNLILASYEIMHSCPGVIRLYKNDIKLYVSSLIKNVSRTGNIGLNSALYSVFFLIQDLICHESFHHYCDIKRQLTGSKFDLFLEEKLAVAHSHNSFSLQNFLRAFNMRYTFLYDRYQRLININQPFLDLDKLKKKNRVLLDYLMTLHFKAYQANCYKDWHLHTHSSCYKTDFYNYVKNNQLDLLVSSGVPMNNIFDEMKFFNKNEGAIIIIV